MTLAATKSLELELPNDDNKCSRTHYHESQIISSSQTTMPVAFFTLQDSFFAAEWIVRYLLSGV